MRPPKFLLPAFAGLFLFAAMATPAFSKEPSKLILKAKIVKIEAFDPSEIVDALDEVSAGGSMPNATVVFKIQSVVKGTLPPVKLPKDNEASVWDQTKDAYKDKNILKIVTMDYRNPDIEREDRPRWFAVAVQSPSESFGVVSWSDLPATAYRLEFAKEAGSQGWVLKSAKPQ